MRLPSRSQRMIKLFHRLWHLKLFDLNHRESISWKLLNKLWLLLLLIQKRNSPSLNNPISNKLFLNLLQLPSIKIYHITSGHKLQRLLLLQTIFLRAASPLLKNFYRLCIIIYEKMWMLFINRNIIVLMGHWVLSEQRWNWLSGVLNILKLYGVLNLGNWTTLFGHFLL